MSAAIRASSSDCVGSPITRTSTERQSLSGASLSSEKKLLESSSIPPSPKASAPAHVPAPYSLPFWSAQLRAQRKGYLIGMSMVTLLLGITIFSAMALYWGSLWHETHYISNLGAIIIDRDGGAVGANITAALLATNSLPSSAHLGWKLVDASMYPDAEALEWAIATQHKAWLALEIALDLSARLNAAQLSADASWNATQALTLVYSEARNNMIVSPIVVSTARNALAPILARVQQALAVEFADAQGNDAVSRALQSAPQTIVSPIGYGTLNLRPWDQPVAVGPTLIGLIYSVIFAFTICMSNVGLRMPLSRVTRPIPFLVARLALPLLSGTFVTLFFTLLNAAFGIHFDHFLGGVGPSQHTAWAAGFLTYWTGSMLAMWVFILSLELAMLFLDQRFMPYFLLFFILTNVSVAQLDYALQPAFYRFGWAMPFPHLKRIFLSTIFNVGSRADLALSFGVLLVWVSILLAVVPLVVLRHARRAQAKEEKASAAGQA